jgi:ankyrin repeat protein
MKQRGSRHRNVSDPEYRSDLIEAIKAGEKGRVTEMLGLTGRLSNGSDGNQVFALHIAAHHGKSEIVALLIENGIDINAKAERNWNALHIAADCGQADVARLLLASGADINAKESGTGATPLMDAAYRGRDDIVRILLDAGADVNAKRFDGGTALTLAALNDKTEIVRMLLDAGADRSARDNLGWTALDLAAQIHDNSDPSYQCPPRNPETAELLRSYFPSRQKKTGVMPPRP